MELFTVQVESNTQVSMQRPLSEVRVQRAQVYVATYYTPRYVRAPS